MQDFSNAAERKKAFWPVYAAMTGLPYVPSVSPGWDASPRAVDYGEEKPRRYPWSPVISGRDPDKFSCFTRAAIEFAIATNPADPLCLISSFNEWSEGHYLEPDLRYGLKWLEAVKAAAKC